MELQSCQCPLRPTADSLHSHFVTERMRFHTLERALTATNREFQDFLKNSNHAKLDFEPSEELYQLLKFQLGLIKAQQHIYKSAALIEKYLPRVSCVLCATHIGDALYIHCNQVKFRWQTHKTEFCNKLAPYFARYGFRHRNSHCLQCMLKTFDRRDPFELS